MRFAPLLLPLRLPILALPFPLPLRANLPLGLAQLVAPTAFTAGALLRLLLFAARVCRPADVCASELLSSLAGAACLRLLAPRLSPLVMT